MHNSYESIKQGFKVNAGPGWLRRIGILSKGGVGRSDNQEAKPCWPSRRSLFIPEVVATTPASEGRKSIIKKAIAADLRWAASRRVIGVSGVVGVSEPPSCHRHLVPYLSQMNPRKSWFMSARK